MYIYMIPIYIVFKDQIFYIDVYIYIHIDTYIHLCRKRVRKGRII